MTAMQTADGGPPVPASRIANIVSSLGSPITYVAATIAMHRRSWTTTRCRRHYSPPWALARKDHLLRHCSPLCLLRQRPRWTAVAGGAVWWSCSAGASQSWQRHR
jgi:hypothetical protein